MNRSAKRQTDYSQKPCGMLLALLLLPLSGVGKDVEIHRCPQPDGTVAFQETPCPEPADAGDGDSRTSKESNRPERATRNELPDVAGSNDESEGPHAVAVPPARTPVTTERAECEKAARDAIDAIDDEMRKNRTREAREKYLGELLDLTQQLRACKQL